jgi:hypothetical protein
VSAIYALVFKGIKEANDMLAAGMVGFGLDNLIEELDLVDSGLGVMGGGTDDLEGNMFAVRVVAREPNGGKVTPAELAHDSVFAILELLANLDGVVTAFAVILRILLIGSVLGGVFDGRG